jgi:putative Ca2+/H+ antiporter (TMEM165/GDT1 family)
MDALLPAFLAAALAEIGDKTQFLAVLLAMRYRNAPVAVLAGISVAAIANSLIAGIGGGFLASQIGFRAITLLLALALVFTGIGGLFPQKQPKMGLYDRFGPFGASAIAFFILEFGDKTQFLTFALAARAHAPLLAAAGAAAGIILASTPAILLGDQLSTTLPIRAARIGIGILFAVVGTIVALGTLRLV